jgi:hypothetical protein
MVLRRRWVDYCRGVKRRRTISMDSVAEPVYSIDWWNRELAQSLTFPFALCDLRYLYSWSLRDRIEVLTLSGFFVRVSTQRWELLVREYETELGVRLSRPFPPYRIETPEDRLSLVNELAESTGQRPNSVRQNYIRKMHRLAEFPSIRRLRIGEDCDMT